MLPLILAATSVVTLLSARSSSSSEACTGLTSNTWCSGVSSSTKSVDSVPVVFRALNPFSRASQAFNGLKGCSLPRVVGLGAGDVPPLPFPAVPLEDLRAGWILGWDGLGVMGDAMVVVLVREGVAA